MAGRFMASAAVTGLLLSAPLGAAPVAAQQAVASDSSFIQMAASLGLLQAKLGKMAAEKGSSPNVKEFGKRMVEEYSKANEELAAGAKQAAFPAPLLLRQHKQIVDQFLGMNGSSFDKSYLAQAVSDHNEAVRLFKQEAEGGKVASLKALASRMLPAVEQQQALAVQTAGSVGAGDTAATPGEQRQGS